MILVDTSIWIDHLHRSEPNLVTALESASVCTHPMVIGELAVGSLKNRADVIGLLENLVGLTEADHHEVIRFVESERLHGRGLSYIDAHLLASTRLNPGTELWTRDNRLRRVAAMMGVAAELS